jgi:putative glycosyltransferase (TIGR04372 family)
MGFPKGYVASVSSIGFAVHYLARLPVRFLVTGSALILFCLFEILRPLVRVRVARLYSDRIGYLSINTELYLRRSCQNPEGRFDILVAGELDALCNHALLAMIKRKLLARRSGVYVGNRFSIRVFEAMKRLFPGSELWFELPISTDCVLELNTVPPQLTFTEVEEKQGKRLLSQMSVEPAASFVCFHSRDQAYLESVHHYRSRGEWSYHEYRNCDIRNFLPAVRYLASVGIYGLRMGYMVERAIEDEGDLIIDYASSYRSEFGDVYLPAKCKFYLGSEGGLSSMPWTFNVPVAYSNVILGHVGFRGPDVFIVKKLWWREKKRIAKFREVLAMEADTWGSSQQFEEAGLEVLENSSDEILALTVEMNARLDGSWVTTDEDEALQARFQSIFPPEHRCHHDYQSPMGSEFLRQNKELLD